MTCTTFTSESTTSRRPGVMLAGDQPCSTSSERTPTPLDIVLNIARHLETDRSYATLASLTLCCKAGYTLVAPILYANFVVSGPLSEALFDLTRLDDIDDDILTIISSSTHDEAFFQPIRPARRLWLMSHIERLSIRQFPDEAISKRFYTSSKLLARSRQHVLPRLKSVHLGPAALDGIRTFQPSTYDKPHSPAFLEALVISSQPDFLQCEFRVLPSDRYTQHCAASTNGAYNLVSRLNQLRADGWTSIKVFQVQGAVHQVLPSLPGVENRYHFSPHRFPLSPDADCKTDCSGMPGPQWTYRAWQCMTAVKSVIKAAQREPAGMIGTSWSFGNISGHVMTVPKTDLRYDDELGATQEEVVGLIKDCVEHSLERDLQFEEGKAAEVLSRITWV